MNPTVHGKLYPEIDSATLLRPELRLFVDHSIVDSSALDSVIQIDTLGVYLRDIPGCSCQIHFVLSKEGAENQLTALIRQLGATEVEMASEVSPEVEEALPEGDSVLKIVASTALDCDADCIVTSDQSKLALTDDCRAQLSISIENWTSVLSSCEVFVRGHEIPWSFKSPMWGCPFGPFYTMTESRQSLLDLYGALSASEKQFDTNIIEYGRSIAYPRMTNLCYARDKLLFYSQQRRATKRAKLTRQDFWFEAGYHLNHYYLLLWGGLALGGHRRWEQ